MLRLLSLKGEERKALGVSARARIEHEFTIERCTKRFAVLYADVMEKPTRQ
jgi:glycosyltransferase involved in cell wall biosynthesis